MNQPERRQSSVLPEAGPLRDSLQDSELVASGEILHCEGAVRPGRRDRGRSTVNCVSESLSQALS
jgi:hypothetical protein